MKLELTSWSPYMVTFQASFDEKKCIPLSAVFSVPQSSGKNSKGVVTIVQQLDDLQERYPDKEWPFDIELRFYDRESPKVDIALEGELLNTLHDILKFGSNNERLRVSINATADFVDHEARNLGLSRDHHHTIKAENMELATNDDFENQFRYIQKEIVLPEATFRSTSVWTYLEFHWTISVELEVTDLIDFTDLIPQVSEQTTKMLEEKLFCDFEFISIDGVSVPCHKVIISASSDAFKAKCEGKLSEPSKDKMTLKITTESVNALLEFIYCGKVLKPMRSSLIASELFQEGHTYNIAGLEQAMVAIFLQKPNEWYDVDVAFNLLRFLVNYEGYDSSELKRKIIVALALKSDELNFDLVKEVFTKFPEQAVKIFAALTQDVREKHYLHSHCTC